MKDIESPVLENRYIGEKTYRLILRTDLEGIHIKPGQFLMLKVGFGSDPLLRRAFAVAEVDGGDISVFYDVIGRGTYYLSKLKAGDTVKVLLPLGRGSFPLDGNEHVLIGGGIGIAGLTLLGRELKKRGKKITFVYGAKSREFLTLKDYLFENFEEVILFTEDGSEGNKGYVTDILKDLKGGETIHACGPKPMLLAFKKFASRFKIFLSLEAPMACGWGVCLGCVVKKGKKYVRTCYEGPVFEASEVDL